MPSFQPNSQIHHKYMMHSKSCQYSFKEKIVGQRLKQAPFWRRKECCPVRERAIPRSNMETGGQSLPHGGTGRIRTGDHGDCRGVFPPRYCSVCSPSARCHAEGIDVNESVQGSAGAVLILEFPATAPDFLLGAAGSLL